MNEFMIWMMVYHRKYEYLYFESQFQYCSEEYFAYEGYPEYSEYWLAHPLKRLDYISVAGFLVENTDMCSEVEWEGNSTFALLDNNMTSCISLLEYMPISLAGYMPISSNIRITVLNTSLKKMNYVIISGTHLTCSPQDDIFVIQVPSCDSGSTCEANTICTLLSDQNIGTIEYK